MEYLGVVEARKKLLSKEISSKELAGYYLERIERLNPTLNAFLFVNKEDVIKKAEEFDNTFETRKEEKLGGIPIALKDAYCTKDIPTTASSNILKNFVPKYESTVSRKLGDAGALNIGKTNLDAFCHGSSTITSDYGPSRNPWDVTKLPGGSSGGSAVAVAADLCCAAMGTETAGSIRQPSSWSGTVGLKPTYGRVSRYGVIAMGSSLDSPGPMTKNVDDAAFILGIIAGHDTNDFTTSKTPVPDYFANLNPKRIKGLRIGLPKEFMALDLEKGVRERMNESIKIITDLGGEIVEVSILDPKYSIAVYTLSCRSEVSSNLARYDGSRYSPPGDDHSSVSAFFESTRGLGFGDEAKRRVMTGTFALSAGYTDKYYRKSELVRQMIREDFDNILSKVDVIIGPTTPVTALTDSTAANDPLFGEMMDVLAEGSSLAGHPGISIPMGLSNNMPIGLQIIGRHFDEQIILDVAKGFEEVVKPSALRI